MLLYVQAGPGIYDVKGGGTHGGVNLGLGGIHPVTPTLRLQWGADLHRVFGGDDEEFLTLHLGVLFH